MIRAVMSTACVIAMLAAAARADDVWVGTLRYADVTIVAVQGGDIVFVLNSVRLTKPLRDVTRISVASNDCLSRAEERASNGEYAESLQDYDAALGKTCPECVKTLIPLRRQRAEKLKADPPAKTPTAPLTPASAAVRCAGCNSTGWSPCPDCRVGDRWTGKTKCADCSGRGRITCPGCEGRFNRGPCLSCNGRGKWVSGTRSTGVFTEQVESRCSKCNARGFKLCPECGTQNEPQWGTIRCPTCGGLGLYGDCLTCRTRKNIPCTRCAAGAKAKEEFAKLVAAMPASAPASSQPSSATPERLLESAPKPADVPADATQLQRDLAAKRHQSEIDQWVMTQKVKLVKWTLVVQDVRSSGSEIAVRATSAAGIPVSAYFPRSYSDSLTRVGKGQTVIVSGRINQVSPSSVYNTSSDGLSRSVDGPYNIRLEGRAIEVVDAPVKPPK